jgi:hypothetical protein
MNGTHKPGQFLTPQSRQSPQSTLGRLSDAPRVNDVFRRIPVHGTPIRRTAKQANQQNNCAMKHQLTGVSIHSCLALALQDNPPVL